MSAITRIETGRPATWLHSIRKLVGLLALLRLWKLFAGWQAGWLANWIQGDHLDLAEAACTKTRRLAGWLASWWSSSSSLCQLSWVRLRDSEIDWVNWRRMVSWIFIIDHFWAHSNWRKFLLLLLFREGQVFQRGFHVLHDVVPLVSCFHIIHSNSNSNSYSFPVLFHSWLNTFCCGAKVVRSNFGYLCTLNPSKVIHLNLF